MTSLEEKNAEVDLPHSFLCFLKPEFATFSVLPSLKKIRKKSMTSAPSSEGGSRNVGGRQTYVNTTVSAALL